MSSGMLRHLPAQSAFLDSLPAAEREAVLLAGHERLWSAGETMFREGDPAGSAVIVLAGLLKIHKQTAAGGEVILALRGPGDLLGEVSAVPGAVRTAHATALERVRGVTIPVPDLRSLLSRHPRLSLALLEMVMTRLRTADLRRLEYATAESLPRVTSRLVELTERFGVAGAGGRIDVAMPINQEELASWSAASLESTARALRTLRELKLIETHRRRLVVLDLERLRAHESRL
jgi:CRP/FNR family transcriptional regulator, cyclic AMP receptor protein